MLTKKEFEKLKSDLLRCSPQQKQQAQAVLLVATVSSGRQSTELYLPVAELYEALRDSILPQGAGIPASFSTLRRLSPSTPPKLEMLHKILEQYLDRYFAGCSKQERSAVRNLLIDAAVDFVPAGVGRLERLISVLSAPEQVMEEAFPGYSDAGVLRERLLQHVRMGATHEGN